MTEAEQNALTDRYIGLIVGIQGIAARINATLNSRDAMLATHWDVKVAGEAHDMLLDAEKHLKANL